MDRRTFMATLGAATAGVLSACVGQVGRETIVDDDLQSKYRRDIEVGAGETLRIEVRPLNPTYQLFMIVIEKRELNREGNVFEALSELDRVEGETAKEVTPDEDTTYVVGVGWFQQEDNLNTDQYHIKITVG